MKSDLQETKDRESQQVTLSFLLSHDNCLMAQ